ncbi:hypothetical protein [Neolewinella sp.]|uniref:hypothetical protein n=1 Tax=Neolewinella sp. TaxID=2993543 RepID=UPI003B519268
MQAIWNSFTSYLRRDERLALHLVLALVVGYLLLTVFVYLLPTSIIDIEFSEEVQEHQSPGLDWFMRAIS